MNTEVLPVQPDQQTQAALAAFLQANPGTAERVQLVRAALDSPAGPELRRQLAEWVVQLVPVDRLVPLAYREWRPLVRDAMMFVVRQLSSARLAPKIVEQIELTPETTPEARLLCLISKVPGLQKIGQVLAHNRNLHPRLRRALSRLENGISDVQAQEIGDMIRGQLGPLMARHAVRLERSILAEASVSAVLGFTWRDPQSGVRRRGVFKVMKPYIPGCYAEDMRILQRLTIHLTRRHAGGGFNFAGLADSLTEIRLLLEREVDFRGEQAALAEAGRAFAGMKGITVPRVVVPLCTDTFSALGRVLGVKASTAVRKSGAQRRRVAERLAEALIAVPALSPAASSMFHADPHAGNLLYDRHRDRLTVLDWALTEHLTRAQRRHMLLLSAAMLLRDEDGMCRAIAGLRQGSTRARDLEDRIVRRKVAAFLDELPFLRPPGMLQAMNLLESIGLEGVRFQAALLMFRKATFTLDGVLEDIAGRRVDLDAILIDYALRHWPSSSVAVLRLLTLRDWLSLESSLLTFPARRLASAVRRIYGPAAELEPQPV